MNRLIIAFVTGLLTCAGVHAQSPGTVANHAFALGKGAGFTGYTSLLCGSAQLAVGQAAADPICRTITGDVTLSTAGALTLATVNANTGAFGSATNCPTITLDGKGRATAASQTTCTPAIGSVTGLAAGFATFAGTPSSANLAALLTDETGTGAAVFAASPTLTGSPLAPTQAAHDNSTKIATTAYVDRGISSLVNSLGADVLLNNTANFFDGPSTAQGTTGTWYASGTITLSETTTAIMQCKLWDGTTIIAASEMVILSTTTVMSLALSGVLTSPAANIRISCKDATNTTGKIVFNVTGTSKDSTLTTMRLQ